jgi:dTDP-glucose 4,6-dehydratase
LNEIRNLDLVRQICSVLDELRLRAGGRSYRELIKFVADRPGHDRRYAVNCRKIKQELGWQPQEKFASGLRATVAWYLENRKWCAKIAAKKYQRNRLGLAAVTKS